MPPPPNRRPRESGTGGPDGPERTRSPAQPDPRRPLRPRRGQHRGPLATARYLLHWTSRATPRHLRGSQWTSLLVERGEFDGGSEGAVPLQHAGATFGDAGCLLAERLGEHGFEACARVRADNLRDGGPRQFPGPKPHYVDGGA